MGNSNGFCSSYVECDINICSKSNSSEIPHYSILEEKLPPTKDSFKISSEDLKLSHKNFRCFLLSKLKNLCAGDEALLSYYELYKQITKDRKTFESIYWLFSIKWIEYNQINQICSRGKLFETAVSLTSIQNTDKNNVKVNSSFFLKFIVDEIINNNYKITQIMERFRSNFFKLNQKYLQNDQMLESLDENSLQILKNNMIKELQIFLLDPLKDFIVFFYSSALEKIVFNYLSQNFQFMNLFIIDIIHHLVFKSQNRIYNILTNILSKTSKRDSLIFKEQMSKSLKFSLISLMEGQDFIIPNEILSKVEEMSFFDNACSKVRLISEVRTPLMKLEIISQIQKEILNSLMQINIFFGLNLELNKLINNLDADKMISIYCYIIFKSKHFEIIKEIRFIERFVGSNLMQQTPWGYLYEILRSSVEYILTFNAK